MKQSAAATEDRDPIATQARTLLASYDLLRAYDYVVVENPSNELPYHNLHHTNCLVINCAAGAVAMNLPEEERRVLLLSAVFHDFAHSGGRRKDHHNIGMAVAALRSYCATDASVEDAVGDAVGIIESTEFPPVAEPVTLSEKIIRDADMMQIYMPGWREQILVGLRKEIEVATSKPMSLAEMVRVQVSFMESVRWHTSWAKERADGAWATLIDAVRSVDVSR
jgi:hypothetical protein